MILKILNQNDIKKSVSMIQAIHAVKKAFIQLSLGKAVVPLRTKISVKKHKGETLFMSAYLADSHSLGAKIVSVFPGNLEKRMSTIHALMIVVDAKTGLPEAIMDGAFLTALRTGAASGLATDFLATKDARIAAIFGSGVQGRFQLDAVCAVRKIEKVYVYDRKPDAAKAYVKEKKKQKQLSHIEFFIAQNPAQAIHEADVICAATTSFTPVFNDTDLKPGTHINGIGSYTPEMQEIPEQTIMRAKVFVDSISACLSEAGDLIVPLKKSHITKAHIQGEIGQVASGSIPGREGNKEITFFKSVGIAVQDVAVANLILQESRKSNLGIDVDL
ncbi:ornithine cyclodeaminase family protein [Acidobacteriota bacterium]